MSSKKDLQLIDYEKDRDLLKSIQGNILNKHGGGIELFVFLKFVSSSNDVSIQLSQLDITSAWEQYQNSKFYKGNESIKMFIGCYLTYNGYKYLGFNDSHIPKNEAFRAGMHSRNLGDPERSEWEEPYNCDIDAALILIDDSEKDLKDRLDELKQAWGSSIVGIQWGHKLENEHGQTIEHFGYVDGISQPIFLKDQYEKVASKDVWDPAASPSIVLEKEPQSDYFGSYLVFRKLEQNVKAFKDAEERLANTLGFSEETEEVAGALIVGRFEHGLPVVKFGSVPDAVRVSEDNDFDYSLDPEGLRCPFHAHIRKTNPRGDSTRSFGITEDTEKDHRIARRGITYDEADRNGDLKQYPEKGVGLLFLCFQRDIINQFEFIQQSWANNNDFPKPFTGIDPVIGQNENREDGKGGVAEQKWRSIKGDQQCSSLAGFVKMKGGEYFFAPSIEFFKNLNTKK